MPNGDLVTTKTAAEALGYTTQHVRRLVKEGRLDGEKVGRDWLIRKESLRRFVASKENIDLPLELQNDSREP